MSAAAPEVPPHLTPPIEFRFLRELQYLISNAKFYFHHIREQSAKWTAASAEADRIANRMPYDRPRIQQGAFEEQMAIKLHAQSEIFGLVDALLATLGRIAFILFSQVGKAPATARARAIYLQTLLEIPDDHLLREKGLRNAWTHFDEHLDKLPPKMAADRFSTLADLDANPGPGALRQFAIDARVIAFANVGRFSLDALEAAVADLSKCVDAALNSWAARRMLVREEE
jgi:hypothetical protein